MRYLVQLNHITHSLKARLSNGDANLHANTLPFLPAESTASSPQNWQQCCAVLAIVAMQRFDVCSTLGQTPNPAW